MAPRGFYQRFLQRVRRLVVPPAFREIQERLRGRSGIEIGGPSAVFQRLNRWPIYPIVRRLDILNYAAQTLWSGTAPMLQRLAGRTPPGTQLVGEATEMPGIAPGSYDFLLASHVVEHIANPLRALAAWHRVVRPGGTIVLVVPHRDGTFDHRRALTSLDHLMADFRSHTAETDATHVPEILELHDLQRDPGAGSREAFTARAADNARYRSLHHHVFDTELVLRLVDKAGWSILYVDVDPPAHICVACECVTPASENSQYWSADAAWRRRSPFPSDATRP